MNVARNAARPKPQIDVLRRGRASEAADRLELVAADPDRFDIGWFGKPDDNRYFDLE